MQREDNPAVAEGEDGPFLSRAKWVMVHARAPDVASGLAREGVIDSTDENLGTKRQQEPKDGVAEIVEVPAGLTEETMERAEVFEVAQLPGLNDASERTAAGTENPGAGQCPEGRETGLGKAGLKGKQERSKGTDEQIGHRGTLSFINVLKDMQLKKKPQRFLRSSSRSRLRPEICFSHF